MASALYPGGLLDGDSSSPRLQLSITQTSLTVRSAIFKVVEDLVVTFERRQVHPKIKTCGTEEAQERRHRGSTCRCVGSEFLDAPTRACHPP
jgi:hypothetical protein